MKRIIKISYTLPTPVIISPNLVLPQTGLEMWIKILASTLLAERLPLTACCCIYMHTSSILHSGHPLFLPFLSSNDLFIIITIILHIHPSIISLMLLYILFYLSSIHPSLFYILFHLFILSSFHLLFYLSFYLFTHCSTQIYIYYL